MTGFGRGEVSVEGVRFRVEMSSVNRKQRDVVVNLPREMSELESKLRGAVSERISRGRVVIHVSYENVKRTAASLRVDRHLAKQYREALSKLAKDVGQPLELSAQDLLRAPGIIVLQDSPVEPATALPHIEKALAKALTGFERTRSQEGANLKRDLLDRLRAVRLTMGAIAKESPGVVKRHRESMHKRLSDAGLEISLDDERLVKEIGLFAERCDISEEITRVDSHLKQFQNYVKSSEPVGRAMDFLAQELHREFNTVGSKANSASIAQLVVEGKTEVEKIREQVQNVE
jgi:uncharacterized protein (TIGR00255 family)